MQDFSWYMELLTEILFGLVWLAGLGFCVWVFMYLIDFLENPD